MEKMKILFLAPSMRIGGAERVLATLIKLIDRKQFIPELVLVNKVGPLLHELPDDVPVTDLRCRKVRYSLPKIVQLIRRRRPALVFSTLGHLNLTLLVCRFLIPSTVKFVIRETNIPSINLKHSKFPRLFPLLYGLLYGKADKIICQSKDMREDLIEEFAVSRKLTAVINNPVDVDEIRRRSEFAGNLYCKKGINLLAVGKLKYQKGFDLLLEAMAYIKESEIHLTILGNGPEKGSLLQLKHALGLDTRVTFIGAVKNPYGYMSQADLFVLSSRFEGFPNVVLEAMSCGTPVIAFECPGGINEIIKNGENGWKVNIGDLHGFADAIIRSSAMQWDSAAIRASVLKKYGVRKIVDIYEKEFLETASC